MLVTRPSPPRSHSVREAGPRGLGRRCTCEVHRVGCRPAASGTGSDSGRGYSQSFPGSCGTCPPRLRIPPAWTRGHLRSSVSVDGATGPHIAAFSPCRRRVARGRTRWAPGSRARQRGQAAGSVPSLPCCGEALCPAGRAPQAVALRGHRGALSSIQPAQRPVTRGSATSLGDCEWDLFLADFRSFFCFLFSLFYYF